MIQASIYGRLGGDPVERETRNGNAMATASLAVNVARASADEDTAWFSLADFGKTGEALLRHHKGATFSRRWERSPAGPIRTAMVSIVRAGL